MSCLLTASSGLHSHTLVHSSHLLSHNQALFAEERKDKKLYEDLMWGQKTKQSWRLTLMGQ